MPSATPATSWSSTPPAGAPSDHVGWERRYLSRLSGTLIDGAVLVTPTVVDVGYGAPIVAVDPHTGHAELPTVDSDNLRGAQLATEHLIALGHRRIALLTGRPDLESAQLREQGYRQALAAAGVPVDEDLVQVGDYDPGCRSSRPRASCSPPPTRRPPSSPRTTSRPSRPSRVAAELGLRVPADLSVVGFDNVPESALTTPAADHRRAADPRDGRRARSNC